MRVRVRAGVEVRVTHAPHAMHVPSAQIEHSKYNHGKYGMPGDEALQLSRLLPLPHGLVRVRVRG